MADRETREITGTQITFLLFAVVVLTMAALKLSGPWTEKQEDVVSRIFIFGTFLVALGVIPGLRRACKGLLAVPIARRHRIEVATIAVFHLLTPFAFAGALVAWISSSDGPLAVAERMSRYAPTDTEFAYRLSLMGIAISLMAWTLGPLVEELIFRGFMFRAWARQWGWGVSLVLTASVFGFYHDFFVPAFTASVIYTCLYIRTGSLWAPIAAHCLHNVAVWPPFLGQFIFHGFGYDAAILSNWWFHFTCLFLHVMILPLYLWMAAAPNNT